MKIFKLFVFIVIFSTQSFLMGSGLGDALNNICSNETNLSTEFEKICNDSERDIELIPILNPQVNDDNISSSPDIDIGGFDIHMLNFPIDELNSSNSLSGTPYVGG